MESLSNHVLSRIESEEWIKKSMDQEQPYGVKEFLLALENTKLRREVRRLDKLLGQRTARQ